MWGRAGRNDISRRRSVDGIAFVIEPLIGTETIRDAAFLQIVRRHFDTDPVPGEDADTVDTHTTG